MYPPHHVQIGNGQHAKAPLLDRSHARPCREHRDTVAALHEPFDRGDAVGLHHHIELLKAHPALLQARLEQRPRSGACRAQYQLFLLQLCERYVPRVRKRTAVRDCGGEIVGVEQQGVELIARKRGIDYRKVEHPPAQQRDERPAVFGDYPQLCLRVQLHVPRQHFRYRAVLKARRYTHDETAHLAARCVYLKLHAPPQ